MGVDQRRASKDWRGGLERQSGENSPTPEWVRTRRARESMGEGLGDSGQSQPPCEPALDASTHQTLDPKTLETSSNPRMLEAKVIWGCTESGP